MRELEEAAHKGDLAVVRAAQDRLEADGLLVREFCADFRDSCLGSTGAEEQPVLRLLVDRIEVDPDGDRGRLYGMIPLPVSNSALLPHCQVEARSFVASLLSSKGGLESLY